MKKKLILILGIMATLSLSSCASRSEDNGLPVSTTVTSETITTSEPLETLGVESTIPQNESDDAVGQSAVTTETIETTEGDVTPYASIEDIPKEIYDPDSTLSVTEQLAKLEEPYEQGLITDEQLDIIADQLFNKGNSGSSTNGSTEANGDTYIPAHGNPGTPDTGEILGYEHANDNIDYSKYQNVTIN